MRVLVADDSTLYRRVMTEALKVLPGVLVVGQAPNGKFAVQKARELKPDLLTLDMEMPELDGLGVLDALRASGDLPAVIVVSSLTRQGGRLTIQALQKGAFDFITKPDTVGAEASMESLRSELAPRLKALDLRLSVRGILKGAASAAVKPAQAMWSAGTNASIEDVGRRMAMLSGKAKPDAVLIGVSTGGPNALALLLPALPAGLGVPIFVVQHMPPLFTQSLADTLASKSRLRVREAFDGETAQADTVYIAPGGRHLRIAPGPEGRMNLQITDDPPENNCRPSVDYLFRSAAIHFPGRVMSVILTGMGSDGVLGLRLLKRSGCFVIAQDEASCVVYGMPKAAVEAGVVDVVLPLEAIAGRIAAAVRGSSV